jgi:hypothetical protein
MVMLNTGASRRVDGLSCPGDHCVFALLLCLLVRANCADAEEANVAVHATPLRSIAPANTKPESLKSMSEFGTLRTPDLYPNFDVTPSSMYSTTEFRPRGTSLSTAATATHDQSVPMLRDTNIWERMADFKSSRGVRLLTLWESRGSTLSLQAGHGGGALLQWTSRTFGHGEGTHSLLDHLFSTSIGDMQPMPRAVKSAAATRPAHLIDRPDESGAQPRD